MRTRMLKSHVHLERSRLVTEHWALVTWPLRQVAMATTLAREGRGLFWVTWWPDTGNPLMTRWCHDICMWLLWYSFVLPCVYFLGDGECVCERYGERENVCGRWREVICVCVWEMEGGCSNIFSKLCSKHIMLVGLNDTKVMPVKHIATLRICFLLKKIFTRILNTPCPTLSAGLRKLLKLKWWDVSRRVLDQYTHTQTQSNTHTIKETHTPVHI